MALIVVLMVCWIVLLADFGLWIALTLGTIMFSLILIGLTVYLVLTVKEVRLNQRQANFIDSVTHELKTPIASLKLYLETLQMRSVDAEQREEFYGVMQRELVRLDHLINQLLEVGRLDAIGQNVEPEDIELEALIRKCSTTACQHHHCDVDYVISFAMQPAIIHSRPIILEMIFGNLIDNAIKYAGQPPRVHLETYIEKKGNAERVIVRISDNGEGIPRELRTKIFRIFYRAGSELERTRKGTGLGLYIARTLVRFLKGSIEVLDPPDGKGSLFQVDLPGRGT